MMELILFALAYFLFIAPFIAWVGSSPEPGETATVSFGTVYRMLAWYGVVLYGIFAVIIVVT